MAVDPNIKNKATKIRSEIYGKDVREALASGLEAMSEDVVDNKNRQDIVEQQFQDVLDETTDKDVISAPEIIAARGGHSNLGQNLLSMKQELAQKATKIELSEKRDKSVPIGLNDANSELLSAIQGGTSFELLSIPRNKSVVPEKTTFLTKGTNLFDKNNVTFNKWLMGDGSINDDTEYVLSDYIPVEPNTTYSFKHNPWGGAFYTEDKVLISAFADTQKTKISPGNAGFFRMSVSYTNLDSQQMSVGDVLPPYENFYVRLTDEVTVSKDNIKNDSISIDKISFKTIETGANKFNKNDPEILKGKYISNTTGNIGENELYGVTGFIPIIEGVSYTSNISASTFKMVGFYDENKSLISAIATKEFTPPANARYARVDFLLTEIDELMVYDVNNPPSGYMPYEENYLLNDNIKVSQNAYLENSDMKLKKQPRLYNISDAIERWKAGEKFPVAFMGDSTTDGVRVTGNTDNVVGTDHIEPNAYPYLLEEKLKEYTGNSTLRIYNAGFSGTQTTWALDNIDDVFLNNQYYSDVKMIGFVYGINDRGTNIEIIKSNWKALTLWCYEHDIQPFFVTPQMIIQGREDFESNVNTSTYLTTVIVRALKDFCKEFNLECINMHEADINFMDYSKATTNAILGDILHFADIGHKFEAGFLFSKFIGETIFVTDDKKIAVTNPYIYQSYERGYVKTNSTTKKRYVAYTDTTADTIINKAYIFNDCEGQLNLSVDVSVPSNFYFKVDGVQHAVADLVELEIGFHEIETYTGIGTTGDYYGLTLTKI